MNTNRQNIQSPDHQAGRASSRLILLLAFILAGLTLIAGSPSTGNKVQGATKNIKKCGFGGSELIYDNEKKPVGCQRRYGFWEPCTKCKTGDTECGCEAGCHYNAGYQQGVVQSVTKWETNSFKVGLPTEGWEFLKLDVNGARIMVRQTGYTNQCVYPEK
jgi:hypothetical protein